MRLGIRPSEITSEDKCIYRHITLILGQYKVSRPVACVVSKGAL